MLNSESVLENETQKIQLDFWNNCSQKTGTGNSLSRELKDSMEYEDDGGTDNTVYTWNCLQILRKKNRGTRNQRKNRDHQDQSIKIGQNIPKC